jgi:predicted permease
VQVLRAIWLRLCFLTQWRATKREIDDELRFHLEMLAAHHVAAGLSPEEAKRAARRRLGNVQGIREDCRRARGLGLAETLAQDLGYGLRSLRRSPGFTAVAILTVALGIGATTAIYSVVNAVLLNPVPGPEPERLMEIGERMDLRESSKDQTNFFGVSPPALAALMINQDSFQGVVWSHQGMLELKTEDFVQMAPATRVAPGFFDLLNVRPLLGRTFTKNEATPLTEYSQPGTDSVIVISYSCWQSHFGGNPHALGRKIELSGRQFRVIGVMPPHFGFPAGPTQFWWAAEAERVHPRMVSAPDIRVLVRLKPNVTVQQAEAMLATVAQRLTQDGASTTWYRQMWNQRPGGLGFWIRPLGFEFQGGSGARDLRRTLFGLLGAMVFVMLIVCANIGNLTLARAERRQQELAMRAALGAGRARLTRQLLTESLLVSGLGALVGLAVTCLGIRILASLIPPWMPRLRDIHIDVHVLGFTLLAAVVAGLLFGLAPAWRGGQIQLSEVLKQAGTGATTGLSRSRYRSGLVIIEVAVALVLLAGAGLTVHSVIRLLQVSPGFDPDNLLFVRLNLPRKTYIDPQHEESAARARQGLYAQLHERLTGLPGVEAVGIGAHGQGRPGLKVDGRNGPLEAALDGSGFEQTDLFKTMRIPLLAGRYFDQTDIASHRTVVINETMARIYWPGENPLGKTFEYDSSIGRFFEVVGVVGDIRDQRYDQQRRPTFYRLCHELWGLGESAPFLAIRTQVDPHALIPAIRQELKAAEPRMWMPEFSVVREALYDSTQPQRLYMLYLVAFAGVGLLLAAMGIYGVMAYSVMRRTREIGIRTALGAPPHEVTAMLLKQGARLTAVGTALGILTTFWLTSLIESQLFEVTPADPIVLGGVVLLLFGVALLACLVPARRAASIKTIEALRYE